MKPKGSITKRYSCTKDHKHGNKCPVTWWARVIYTDPETGKTHDLSRRAESKAAAGDKRDALKAEIAATNGQSIGTERMTFADLCDYYEKHYLIEAEYIDGKKIAGLRSLATPKTQLAVLKGPLRRS